MKSIDNMNYKNKFNYGLAILLGLTLIFLGCGSSDPDKDKDKKVSNNEIESTDATNITLATAESARLFFQKRAKEILEENKDKLKNPSIIKLIEVKENISAKRKNLRECYKSIQDALEEEQKDDSIIYGKLENLGFLRDAWEIEVGQFEISMGACIEVKTGKMKVLWVNQEEAETTESKVENSSESKSDSTSSETNEDKDSPSSEDAEK